MVRRFIQGDPVSVLILSGAHDLRDEITEACPACRVEVIKPERMDGMNSVGE